MLTLNIQRKASIPENQLSTRTLQRFLKEMGYGFKEKIFRDCDKKPLTWWQYIHDIFVLWQYGEKELETFLEFLNCYHHTIKITVDYSGEEIHFLDV